MIGLTCGRRRDMKRLWIIVMAIALAATLVGAASATGPAHFRDTLSDSFVTPAGERCDFDYRISFTVQFNDIVFGDPDEPDYVISHVTAFVSHTNLETGYTLTEVDRTTDHLDFVNGVDMLTGIIWKLRTPEGKLVFTQMGQIVFSFEDGDLKRTPHMQPADVSPAVCGLLGGHAA
jgi:hypothetical protein